MRRTCVIAVLALFFMLPAVQAADNICELETLPHYPSMNSSMLLIIPEDEVTARMGSLTPPVKVGYEVYDLYFNLVQSWAWGGMHKFADCYICEFSGSSDFDATCGPTPFNLNGQYNITFAANDFNEYTKFNRVVNIFLEKFIAVAINIGTDRTVYITVDVPTKATNVSVAIYEASTGNLIPAASKYLSPAVDPPSPGRYFAKIEGLREGVYYAEFIFVQENGISGGDLYKINIAPVSDFTIETEKSSYWIGESVEISGVSKYSKVRGSVVTPGSVVALGEKTVTDGRYSFTFYLDRSYSKGTYNITVESGTASTPTRQIEVSELFMPAEGTASMTFRDYKTKLQKNITISNRVNSTISLAAYVEAGSDLKDFVTPALSNYKVLGLYPTVLTLTADPTGLATPKSGKVIVSTADQSVKIPIDVSLLFDIPSAQCPPATGSCASMTVAPDLWDVGEDIDCVAGETLSQTLTITNGGASALTEFSASSADFEIAETSFPDQVAGSGSGNAEISITAPAGPRSGYIEISSGSTSARVYVMTSCAYDNSADVTALRDNFDTLLQSLKDKGFSDDSIDALTSDVEYNLESAESYAESSDFAAAAESLARAQAGYDAIETASGEMGGGGSDGLLMMVLAVAFVAVLGLFLYQNFIGKLLKGRAGGKKKEEEEELF